MELRSHYQMNSEEVRQLCIKNNYCTNCNNQEYSNLLERCCCHPDDNDILQIATTILCYSDIPRLQYESGCTTTEILENIAFQLCNDCCYIIVDIEN